MKSSKRKIIIGGIVAVLGIALLAYVAHVLTAALDSKPGDVSKTQFVVQLGADEKLTDAAADRTLTLDFGEGFAYYVIELTLKAGQSAELRLEYPLENASSILVLNDESTVACDSSRLIINDPNRIKLSCSDEAVAVPEYGGELDLSEGPEQFTINIG